MTLWDLCLYWVGGTSCKSFRNNPNSQTWKLKQSYLGYEWTEMCSLYDYQSLLGLGQSVSVHFPNYLPTPSCLVAVVAIRRKGMLNALGCWMNSDFPACLFTSWVRQVQRSCLQTEIDIIWRLKSNSHTFEKHVNKLLEGKIWNEHTWVDRQRGSSQGTYFCC